LRFDWSRVFYNPTVSYAPQSSPGRFAYQPAQSSSLVLAALPAAQEEQALSRPPTSTRNPKSALVSLPAGAPVETGRARGGWNEATSKGGS